MTDEKAKQLLSELGERHMAGMAAAKQIRNLEDQLKGRDKLIHKYRSAEDANLRRIDKLENELCEIRSCRLELAEIQEANRRVDELQEENHKRESDLIDDVVAPTNQSARDPILALHGMASYVLNHGGWCWNVHSGNMHQITAISKEGIRVDGEYTWITFRHFHQHYNLQKDVRCRLNDKSSDKAKQSD